MGDFPSGSIRSKQFSFGENFRQSLKHICTVIWRQYLNEALKEAEEVSRKRKWTQRKSFPQTVDGKRRSFFRCTEHIALKR